MPITYRVNKGCSLLATVGGVSTLHRSGSILPANYAAKSVIETHVRTGHVIPQGSHEHEEREQDAMHAPGTENIFPTLANDGDDINKDVNIIRYDEKGQARETVRKSGRAKKTKQGISPWTKDPADLQGMSLDELTIMALELGGDDASIPDSFDTIEEAIEFLTRDFKPSK